MSSAATSSNGLPLRVKVKHESRRLWTALTGKYRYQSIKFPHQIRLLALHPALTIEEDISCHLVSVSLDEALDFDALSYTWGDPHPKKKIHCMGRVMEIGLNLHSALCHLRHRLKQRFLWVDALCIDQENKQERSQQVQLMDKIYSCATQTVIWLGIGTDDGTALGQFEIARDLFPPNSARSYLDCSVDERRELRKTGLRYFGNRASNFNWVPITDVLRNPWFERKWIIQEVVNSKRPVLYLSRKALPWSVMEDICFYIIEFGVHVEILRPTGNRSLMIHLLNVGSLGCIRYADGRDRTLITVLDMTIGRFHCLDSRDAIIALLGIATDADPKNENLRPDYAAPEKETFRRYTIWSIMERQSLHPLSLRAYQEGHSDLPSWIPDLTLLDVKPIPPILASHYNFSASIDSIPTVSLSPDGRVLFLRGRIVDEVAIVGPQHMIPTVIDRDDYDERQVPDDFAATKKYVDQCMEIANDRGNHMSTGRNMEFMNTMILRLPTESDGLIEDFAIWMRHVQDPFNYPGQGSGRLITDTVGTILDINRRVTFNHSRFFCRTKAGKLAQLAGHVQPRDKICIFNGGTVPYIIRPRENGSYELIGEGFVDGFMFGEGMRMEGASSGIIDLV